MIEDRAADAPKILSGGRQIALEVPGGETVDEIDQPVQKKEPDEEEVPAPPLRERLVARYGRPPREAALGEHAVGVGEHAEHARGVDGDGADLGIADGRSFEALFGVDREDRGIVLVAADAPM